MARPALARIFPAAFRHNYLYARSLAPDARALAVVKANAYGHGAVPMARAVADVADAYGVACIEEALELREAGLTAPVVLLEGCFESNELEAVDRLGFEPVVHSEYQIRHLLDFRASRPLRIWLKMDSGMHRLGLAPEDFVDAYRRLAESPGIGEIVLMTHLARADELDCATTAGQLGRFESVAAELRGPRSCANSAGNMAWAASRGDWIRPGIMLYGASPLDRPHPADTGLMPAMSLESALIAIRELPAGEAIGYGARFVTSAPTRVGVVAMGYADGYPRQARDGTPVAVNGQLTRLIGRVSMDMLTVDLSDQPEARVGDPVELWGEQVPANAVAAGCDTIAYHLFTGVTRRVPRRIETV